MNITWKGDAPREPLKSQCEAAVVAAGTTWNTTGQTFVEVVIRGADHSMTTDSRGRRVPDARHITANYKDAAQVKAKKHTPAHVYLDGARPDFDIDHVVFYSEKKGLYVEGADGVDDDDQEDDEEGEREEEEGNEESK